MTRSELVDLGWSYPFFEALALFPALASPAADAVRIRRQVTDPPCLVPFEGFRCSRQPATVSPIRLGLARLHFSGHRSVI